MLGNDREGWLVQGSWDTSVAQDLLCTDSKGMAWVPLKLDVGLLSCKPTIPVVTFDICIFIL